MVFRKEERKHDLFCFGELYNYQIPSALYCFNVILESLLLNSINIGPPKNCSILTIHLFNGLWNERHGQGMKIRKRRETNSSTFDPNGKSLAIRKKM